MTAPAGMSTKQLRSIGQATARVNLWSGAIRSGKTIASLVAWLHFVANAPRGGELVVIGRTRQSIARNVFGPLTDPTLFGPLARLVSYTPGADTAMILGRRVWVLGASDARAEAVLRGLTVSGAYVDEATLVSEPFWTQLLGRMSVPGARLFATTNPDGPGHWLKRTVIDRAAALGYRVWSFALTDNAHLDPGYVEQIRREYTGVWARRFIGGEWTVAEGAVYSAWDPDRHVLPAAAVADLPLQRVIGTGIDHGTTNPTRGMLVGLTAEPAARLVVLAEWTPPTGRVNAWQAADLSRWLAVHAAHGRPEWHVVDPAAAGFKADLRAAGIDRVLNGVNAVVPGIRTVSSLIATDRLVVSDACPELVRFLPSYSWDPKATAKGEDAPLKRDDHEVDALRYVVHTLSRSWRDRIPLSAAAVDDDLEAAA